MFYFMIEPEGWITHLNYDLRRQEMNLHILLFGPALFVLRPICATSSSAKHNYKLPSGSVRFNTHTIRPFMDVILTAFTKLNQSNSSFKAGDLLIHGTSLRIRTVVSGATIQRSNQLS